ncbi:MAG: CbiX/SirB N-terminal domain-containing protein [Fuerstiella sp.]|jgi:sirohydrochlorin ferrochelatase|nr:CbiX/SirB N-terminal domain-containing protein [Fuerstiella sp.]
MLVESDTPETNLRPPITAVVIVDHGSRKPASNEMLYRATEIFAAQSTYSIVQPAHMELAQPDIKTAFRICVEQGAERVVVFPYFLSPGRHWSEDIPRLVIEAARPFPDVEWLVTAPFGLHPEMSSIINDRIRHCLEAANGQSAGQPCDVCDDSNSCKLNRGSQAPAADV